MGTFSSGQLNPRPSRERFGVLAFACSLSLITYLDRVCIMRVSRDMRQDLGFGAIAMGAVFAAFAVGYALFEVPGGWMGDRWGSRRVLIRIVLWWSACTALTGSIFPVAGLPLGALTLMLLIRFLFGAGEAGAYPNLTRVVRIWFPRNERATAQGAIWFCARMGGAIAPSVIGLLTGYLGGWRPAFWALGSVGIVWVALFYAFYRDAPARQEPQPAIDEAYPEVALAERPPTPSGHEWPSLGQLAASASLWFLCLISFAVGLGWYFYPTWQPEYLWEVYHIRYEDSEMLTGLPYVCGAFGAILGGALSEFLIHWTGSRRWGRSLIGVFGFTGAGLCVVGTGLTTAWWQAVLLLCLAFFLNDLAIPVMWAVCADVGGRFVGSVAGLMNTTNAIGAVLCMVLIPVVLTYVWPAATPGEVPLVGASARWMYVFAGLGGAWFVGAVGWLFVDAGKPIFGDERKAASGDS